MHLLPLLLAVASGLGYTPAQDPDLESRIHWFDPAPDLDRQLLEAIQAVAEEDTVEGRREITRWARWRERVVRTFRHPRAELGSGDLRMFDTIALGPNGRWLVTGGAETLVWDVEAARLVHQGLPGSPHRVQFSEDGEHALIDTDDDGATVIDLASGARLWDSSELSSWRARTLDPQGRRVAWLEVPGEGASDYSLWVQDVEDSSPPLRLPMGPDRDEPVVWSEDGRWLAVAGEVVSAIDLGSWSGADAEVRVLEFEGPAVDLVFHPARRELAQLNTSRLRVHDLDNPGTPLWVSDIGYAMELVYDPGSDHWIAAGSDGWARVRADGSVATFGLAWDDLDSDDLEDWLPRWALSPDGATLAVHGNHGTVRTWDTRTGRRHQRPYYHGDLMSGLDLGAQGQLATLGADGTVRVWRVGDSPHEDFARWKRTYGSPDLWVAPGDNRGVWIQERHEVEYVDAEGRSWVLPPGEDGLDQVVLHPDGTSVLASGESRRLWSWDLTDRQRLPVWTGALGGSWDLAVSPDGTQLLSSDHVATVVQDLPGGLVRAVLPSHLRLGWSPSGQGLAVTDGWMCTWDPLTGADPEGEALPAGEPILAWDGSGLLLMEERTDQPTPGILWREPDGTTRPVPIPELPPGVDEVSRVAAGAGRLLLMDSDSGALMDLATGEFLLGIPPVTETAPGADKVSPWSWSLSGTSIARCWPEARPESDLGTGWEVRSAIDGQVVQSGWSPRPMSEIRSVPGRGGVLLWGTDDFLEVVRIPEGTRVGPRHRDPESWMRVEFRTPRVASFCGRYDPRFELDLDTGQLSWVREDLDDDLDEEQEDDSEPESPWTESSLEPVHGATVRWDNRRVQVIEVASGDVRMDHVHDTRILAAALQSEAPWLTLFDSANWVNTLNTETREYALRAPLPYSSGYWPAGNGDWVLGLRRSFFFSHSLDAYLLDARPSPSPPPITFDFLTSHQGDVGITELGPDGIWTRPLLVPVFSGTRVRLRRPEWGETPRTMQLNLQDRTAWTCTSRGEHLEFHQLPEPNEAFEPVEGDPAALLEEWALRLGRKSEGGKWILGQ